MKTSLLRALCTCILAGLLLGLTTAPSQADIEVPTVSGRAEIGQTLTASGPSSATFQWYAGPTPISGATSRTFTITPQQADRSISVARMGAGDVPGARSEPTLTVLRVATPTISGTHATGSTLTARPGAWSSSSTFGYRWYADGKVIKGASRSTLKLAKAQGSRRISVQVTGSRSGYQSAARTSARSGKVFTAAATPRITGSRAVGRTLTAKKGTWMAKSRVTFRWYADGRAIGGATKSTLKVPRAAANKKITVRARGTRAGYATVTRTSGATSRVQIIGTPKLSGSTTAGRTIRVSPGTWTAKTKFSYRWYLNGKRIKGANRSTLKVKSGWRGKRLSAKVTGRKSGYSTFTTSTKRSRKVSLPSRTSPISAWECPSWAPIKGNADSGIYHLPHQRFYDATKPEDCFRTEAAARAAGYRKAKV